MNYYLKNRERLLQKRKEYYYKNRETILENAKKDIPKIRKREAGSIVYKYKRLVNNSKRRGLVNELSLEQYSQIVLKKQCYYCDHNFENEVGYNLNRIDSNKGYTLENVKPCCGTCNSIMLDFNKEDLKSRLLKIYKRLK